jgi:hypothetical protein
MSQFSNDQYEAPEMEGDDFEGERKRSMGFMRMWLVMWRHIA